MFQIILTLERSNALGCHVCISRGELSSLLTAVSYGHIAQFWLPGPDAPAIWTIGTSLGIIDLCQSAVLYDSR
jgi:hypothetical protein